MTFIDAHCHLEKATYGDELGAVISRAQNAGLSQFIAVGASGVTDGASEAIALAEAHDFVYATAGIHPHEADKATKVHLDTIEAHLAHPKVVALGEIGLDFYYDNSDRNKQRQVFADFLAMAKRTRMPIMLHIRDAHDESLQALDTAGLPNAEVGGVVHCFSAGPQEAEAYLARGMYLSIPGIVTFKRAEALREAVRQTPLDRLLLETDCPYLAPVPHRGKRNEPAYLMDTAKVVAELKGVTLDELGLATASNTWTLFRLPPKAPPVR